MIFLTTYNKKLFDEYAHRLIETYQSTQQTLPMYVFVEDNIDDFPKIPNVTYLKDAVKFCYKVFAQSAAREFGDKLYYVDSDCVFVKQIPDTWFKECLPDDTFLTFYDRPGNETPNYTETGFLAFDNTKKVSNDFFNTYKDWYISDRIYKLKFFTDCHALDATRKMFHHYPDYKEKKLGDGKIGHIMARDKFINEYIDHRKGPRKAEKHSPEWRRRNG
jgi:hypothetical protein